jgi:hypothetical protein
MSEDSIISVCDPMLLSNIPFPPPLCQSTLDSILLSNDLERQLRALTVEHRKVLFSVKVLLVISIASN